MAKRRGQIKDTGHTSDDEESTASDVESEDKLTELDDTSRRPSTSRFIEGKTTEINSAQSQENKGGVTRQRQKRKIVTTYCEGHRGSILAPHPHYLDEE